MGVCFVLGGVRVGVRLKSLTTDRFAGWFVFMSARDCVHVSSELPLTVQTLALLLLRYMPLIKLLGTYKCRRNSF